MVVTGKWTDLFDGQQIVMALFLLILPVYLSDHFACIPSPFVRNTLAGAVVQLSSRWSSQPTLASTLKQKRCPKILNFRHLKIWRKRFECLLDNDDWRRPTTDKHKWTERHCDRNWENSSPTSSPTSSSSKWKSDPQSLRSLNILHSLQRTEH